MTESYSKRQSTKTPKGEAYILSMQRNSETESDDTKDEVEYIYTEDEADTKDEVDVDRNEDKEKSMVDDKGKERLNTIEIMGCYSDEVLEVVEDCSGCKDVAELQIHCKGMESVIEGLKENIKMMVDDIEMKKEKIKMLEENVTYFMDENVILKNNAKQLKMNNISLEDSIHS